MNILQEYLDREDFYNASKQLLTKELIGQAEEVSDFYSHAPFPGYGAEDTPQTLFARTKQNDFLIELKNTIKPGTTFMEIGCGTGQLSNFLASCTLANVYGLDASIESLKIAERFASKHQLSRVKFIREDIFNLNAYPSASIDYLWCSGVLHHTGNTWESFDAIAHLLKPGGHIFIGLYNKYGRFFTGLRQQFVKLLGDRPITRKVMSKLDPYLRGLNQTSDKWHAWYRDQYLHPFETWHSIDETVRHFSDWNIETVGSIPNLCFDYNAVSKLRISEKPLQLSPLLIRLSELSMAFNSFGKEGGLHLLIGKKKT